MKFTDMLKGISVLKDAMEAGKEVANPKEWKVAQITTSRIVAIVGAVVFGLKYAGVEMPLTDEQITAVAGAIAAVLGVANEVMTTVSSRKVGK